MMKMSQAGCAALTSDWDAAGVIILASNRVLAATLEHVVNTLTSCTKKVMHGLLSALNADVCS